MLDSKFATLRQHFGIQKTEDWSAIFPADVLAIPDIGPQTLNHLRLTLANEGITLAGDQTPAHWQTSLSIMRGTSQIADQQDAVSSPFTILIDKAEQHPFTFAGFLADASQRNRPLVVQSRREHLGPTHGDYTIDGMQGYVQIERKSREDVQGTVLGWGDRREQFQRTLEFLSEIPSSAVIVECSFGEAINSIVSRGSKPKLEMQKIFHRQVNAWHDDFRVPWVFCDNRRLAESTTYRWLERQWKKQRARQKQAEKKALQFEASGL